MYKSELAADQAEVSKAALITEGRPLIPARRILQGNNKIIDSLFSYAKEYLRNDEW